jgi:hypothetical protein
MTCRESAILSLALFALFASGCGHDNSTTPPPPTDVGASWRLVETGVSNSVRAFAANDTMALLVGDGGIVYSSTDGLTWEVRREGGPQDALQDVLWFDSLFVAVGMNGTLLSSPDGDNWSWIGAEDQANLHGLATNDSLVVAVGEAGSIYVSDNGIEWVLHRQDAGLGFTDVAYGDSGWVACAEGGRIYHSSDGITWDSATTGTSGSTDFTTVTAAQGAYFAVGVDELAERPDRCKVYFSLDGLLWEQYSTIDAWYIHDLLGTDSSLVAVGEGTEYHMGYPDGLVFGSTDGDQWTAFDSDAPFSLTCAGRFGGRWLVGGSFGYVLSGPSPDQLTTTTSGAEMTGAVWANGEFVAVTNNGTVMRSSDGSSWSEKHSQASAVFERLAYSGNGFASLGGFGASTEIYFSSDVETWERTLAFQDVILKDVTWGNGKFVACGQDGTVFVSSDGQSWDRHYVGDSVTLRTVLWDGSRYLAAATGIVYRSSNGIDWSKPDVDSTYNEPTISRLAWNGSVYCGVGMIDSPPTGLQGYAFVSSDAVRWTGYPIPIYDNLYDLAWTGTRFVVCGRGGILASSTNGTSWEAAAALTDQTLKDLAVAGGRVIAVGSNRTVLVSP